MSEPDNESDEFYKEQEEDSAPLSTPPPTEEPEVPPVLSTEPLPLESPAPATKPPVSAPVPSPPPQVRLIYRHTLLVRLSHWINVLCLPIMIMSGFQIFNAHPALYLGERSDRDRPIFSMRTIMTDDDGEMKGITTLFGHPFETTGLLGASKDSRGELHGRGFPAWATLPSGKWLAMGRRWHLFFAWVFVLNGLFFGLYSLLSRHLLRDLFPRWRDLRGIGRAVLDHVLFRHATGSEATHYNVLQKIAYTGVVFGLGPLIVLTGLTMSPQMDAAFPGLLTLFGGRQSARTIHFVACFAFIGYTFIHLLMVAVTGLWNNLRSMLVGWYRIKESGLSFLAGCDNLSRTEGFSHLLGSAEGLTRRVQRLITPRKAMAREYTEGDLSQVFPTNGTTDPDTPEYTALAKNNFADWRLQVTGLVERPSSFSLSELRQLPSRTQITRHDCVEGWSAIAKWKGTKLGELLDRVRPLPSARYVVFYCADPDEDGQYYYESIDMEDAFHPQTLLAYELNDRTLPIEYGAPIRLRLERQLGYKMAKYVMRIELVESFQSISGGNGGYWEDQGYEWYAGI